MSLNNSALLDALDFWEMFPYNLACCRSAVMLIEENQDRVFVCARGGKNIPVTVQGMGGRSPTSGLPIPGWQLILPEPLDSKAILYCFSKCFIAFSDSNNSPTIGTPAQYFPKQGELLINVGAASEMHKPAEEILCREMERRKMDSADLVYSGRACRRHCGQMEGPFDVGTPQTWPAAAGGHLGTMHPTSVDAIVAAEKSLLRLRTQLEVDHDTENGGDHTIDVIVRADSKTDNGTKFSSLFPENDEVVKLCRKLKSDLSEGYSQITIARDFTGESEGGDKKAQSLLRQARRFSHLWKQADN